MQQYQIDQPNIYEIIRYRVNIIGFNLIFLQVPIIFYDQDKNMWSN